MDLSVILMGVGILIVIISFFTGNSKKRTEKELEELSMSFYQENNQLKRRLKIIEEELMLSQKSMSPIPKKMAPSASHVNQILVSQVLALHNQGFNLQEIAKRSSLDYDQIATILQNEVTKR